MVQANRFPWNFDGILVQEPANVTATGVVILWNALATHDADGQPLFTPADLDVLHAGAIAACDADDGLESRTSWGRFMGFNPDPGPSWTATDFDFDHDYKRTGMMDALVNGYSNPDLRNFKAAGGKLLIIQGWEDSGLPSPQVSVDYYEMAERIMGGRASTQEAVRLFMIPGRTHCYGGVGAASGDFLSYLEAWVEEGQAPDMIVGYHPEETPSGPRSVAGWVKANTSVPDSYTFTRPHYPYPLQARYKGSGDPNDYRSFEPVEPERP